MASITTTACVWGTMPGWRSRIRILSGGGGDEGAGNADTVIAVGEQDQSAGIGCGLAGGEPGRSCYLAPNLQCPEIEGRVRVALAQIMRDCAKLAWPA